MGNNKNLNQVLIGKDFKFLTIALFITLLFIAILTSGFIYTTYTSILNNNQSESQTLTNTMEQIVSTTIDQGDYAINATIIYLNSLDRDYKKIDPFLLSKNLELIKKNFDALELLAIIDENGDGYALSHWSKEETFKNHKKINVSDRQYFNEHKNNPNSGLIISNPQISKTLGTQVVTINRRMVTKDGKFHGIISTTLNLDKFAQSFERIASKDKITITLLNSSRYLVARYPNSVKFVGTVFKISQKEIEAVKKNSITGRFIIFSPIDHIKRIFTYKKLAKYNFTVYVGRPTDELFSQWYINSFIIAFLAVLVIILIIYFYLKYFKEFLKSEERKVELINSARMSTLGLMAASVAHEINNPLSIILGKANQGAKIIKDEELDRVKILAIFSKIIESSHRMAKIVNGIKVISRDGKLDKIEEVSLEKIILYVHDFVNERFKNSDVNLFIDTVPHLKFRCRESQIAQVLVNLVNNSFDAIEFNNEKWIHIKFEIISNKILKIIVTDSGNGIPDDIVTKMMNPLFTSKPAGKGTGLGLYISDQIMREHSGRLYYLSGAKNTTFVVELPI